MKTRKPRISATNRELVEQAFEAIRQARKHLQVAKKILAVETGLRAGGIDPNHSRRLLAAAYVLALQEEGLEPEDVLK